MWLTEDSIEGRVTVENSSVRRLFEENLDALESSLREQGFEGARLEVAVSDRRERRAEQQEPLPMLRAVTGAEELDRAVPVLFVWGTEAHAVDLVV
jgi:hypothetical protein